MPRRHARAQVFVRQGRVEGQRTEVGHEELALEVGGVAAAEGRLARPVRRLEVAHILDEGGGGDADAAEHVDALDHVRAGEAVRGGHDHGRGQGHVLGEGELDVAGAGGQVHNQEVQRPPLGEAQQLAQDVGGHGPPHHRSLAFALLLLRRVADRHGGHIAPGQDRFHHLRRRWVARGGGLLAGVRRLRGHARGAQQRGNGGPVQVRVENSHPCPPLAQGAGQVDCHRGLAHPALATGHGDDVGHAREACRHERRLQRLWVGRNHLHVGVADPGQGAEGGFSVAPQAAARIAPGERLDLAADALAARIHPQMLGHAQRHHVTAQVAVHDTAKGVPHFAFPLRRLPRAQRHTPPPARP